MREQIDKLEALIKNFNWHSPSWDLFIIMSWAVASVIYAFASGRGRLLSILVSVYISKLMVIEAPFISEFAAKHLPPNWAGFEKLAAFVAIFAIIFLFLSRYAFKTAADHRPVRGFLYSLIFSFFQIGLLLNIILTFLPSIHQERLSNLVHYIFLQPVANFVWLVLPVVFLIFLGRHISDKSEL